MKKSEIILKYAADHSRSQTVWFALKMIGMDTSFLNDGGPGSGNWGHKGRPGHVGGSGKGGGKQYRGGRSDIAYTGSKKDWLNGLTGERQHEAQRFMKRMRFEFSEPGEEEKSVEQNIMEDPHYGGEVLRKKLLDFMAEARGWEEHADRLTSENWDENDRKLSDALAQKYGIRNVRGIECPDDSSGTDKWEPADLACWQDLKSKALGGPVSGKEPPDELQYAAGLKERPTPKTSWAASVPLEDYEDVENAIRKMTGDYSIAADDISDPQKLEGFEKKAFTEGFGNFHRDRGLKLYLKARAKALGLPNASWKEEDYPKEMLDRLTPEEKDRVLKLGRSAALTGENIIEGLDYEDGFVRWQDYAIINKMLGGYDATEDVKKLVQNKRAEEEERRRREAERRKRIEEERKRQEEEQKKIREEAEKVRKEELARGESIYTKTGENDGIAKKEVKKLDKPLTDDEIIERVGGGDKTVGSCVSLSLAYAANKCGLDVLDFRGGLSQSMFSRGGHFRDIIDSPGVEGKTIEAVNDVKAAQDLLKGIKPGEEHILITGKHAAVVRLAADGKTHEYLELQSPSGNGFKPIDKDVLRYRFGCKRSHTIFGMKVEHKNYLVNIKSLAGCKTFENALQYLNTNAEEQKKGASGSAK